MTNKKISEIFKLHAKLLQLNDQIDSLVKEYNNLAVIIARTSEELALLSDEELKAKRFIGTRFFDEVKDVILREVFDAFEEIVRNTPVGVLELLQAKIGLGPKKLNLLWKTHGITDMNKLHELCISGKLQKIKGFSEKSEKDLLEKIDFFQESRHKLLWIQAHLLVLHWQETFRTIFPESVFRATGEYIRQDAVVSMLEMVIDIFDKNKLPDNWKIINETDNRFVFLVSNTIYCTIYVSDDVEGLSEELSYKKDVLETLGGIMQAHTRNIPYYIRDNMERIQAWEQMSDKRVIEEPDIRGLIHCHSKWSDGENTIREMALACMERGLEYMVLSDHSQTSAYANGLDVHRILQQHEEIDALNREWEGFKIYKSIECDILGDGSLDYPDEVLERFDLVICSVHQNLEMTESKAMQRTLGAIENPYTNILGHISGRLLLQRRAFPLNYQEVIAACSEYNVCIELNANPRRLDIDYRFIPEMIKHGVLTSINPDAHAISGIDDLFYGVKIAQKALLKRENNLSSFTRSDLEQWLEDQQDKRF